MVDELARWDAWTASKPGGRQQYDLALGRFVGLEELGVDARPYRQVRECRLVLSMFSTNAAMAGRFFNLIREEFVRMYQGPVLNNLMRDFQTNQSPEVGRLDITGVLDTEYSFA